MTQPATAAQLQRISEVPGTHWAGPRPAPLPEPPPELVLREVRYWRARLQLADAELSWVDGLLQQGNINARGALNELDIILGDFGACP